MDLLKNPLINASVIIKRATISFLLRSPQKVLPFEKINKKPK